MFRGLCLVFTTLIVCAAWTPGAKAKDPEARAGAVDDARLRAADAEPGSWLAHGRNWAEQRHSTLDALNAGNVAQLELRWRYDPETERGLEATPIVVDDTMFFSSSRLKSARTHAARTSALYC